jgi:hypothetical protein
MEKLNLDKAKKLSSFLTRKSSISSDNNEVDPFRRFESELKAMEKRSNI